MTTEAKGEGGGVTLPYGSASDSGDGDAGLDRLGRIVSRDLQMMGLPGWDTSRPGNWW